jgi:hypothetical protein
MLLTKAVEAGTLDLIRKFMSDDRFKDFNLVGGTALALKIGHRLSIDIDLFSTGPLAAIELGQHLTTNYNATKVRTLTNGVFCFVDGVKIDLISHQYGLVNDIDLLEGIRIVSLPDIGAMKLNAIFNNGTRLKDYSDMYALLEIYSLDQLLGACAQKYPDLNISMVKQSLIHFGDIDFSDPIKYVGEEIKWPVIAEGLRMAFLQPGIKFNSLSDSKKEVTPKLEKGKRKKKGRGH